MVAVRWRWSCHFFSWNEKKTSSCSVAPLVAKNRIWKLFACRASCSMLPLKKKKSSWFLCRFQFFRASWHISFRSTIAVVGIFWFSFIWTFLIMLCIDIAQSLLVPLQTAGRCEAAIAVRTCTKFSVYVLFTHCVFGKLIRPREGLFANFTI